LAACRRDEEAQSELAGAFKDSNRLARDELASLQNLKGQTWQALGHPENARAAFEQALALFPFGSNAVIARNALAKLGGS